MAGDPVLACAIRSNSPPWPNSAKAAGGMGARLRAARWQCKYKGLGEEHRPCAKRCRVFDISHMVLLTLSDGEEAPATARTTTHRIRPRQALYTVLLNERAGIAMT